MLVAQFINNSLEHQSSPNIFSFRTSNLNSLREMSNNFMDRLKAFLGITMEPPRNEFRNPIWGSDDDDDDGDELYSRQNNMVHNDPLELHAEVTRQMRDMFRSMSSMFGDIKLFFNEDQINGLGSIPAIADVSPEAEEYNSNSIRKYYLKPGYQKPRQQQDVNLDGKVSSSEISGLLKQKTKDKHDKTTITPFNGNLVSGSSYCKTVITTSVKMPDGSIETKRIVKSGNDVVEETTTTTVPQQSFTPSTTLVDQDSSYTQTNVFIADLTSIFKNFY